LVDPERFRLEPGELLLTSSDGLGEQCNPERIRFDADLAGLEPGATVSTGGLLSLILGRFEAFRRNVRVSDDVTLIALKMAARS
jgi:hypothetical protein